MVALYAPIRVLRASVSALLLPDMAVEAIACSEVVSVLLPLVPVASRRRILDAILVGLYAPHFASGYVPLWTRRQVVEAAFLLVVCVALQAGRQPC